MKNKPKLIQEIEEVLEDLKKAAGLRYSTYKSRSTDAIVYWRVYELDLPAEMATGVRGFLRMKTPTLSLQDITDKLEQEHKLITSFPTNRGADYLEPDNITGLRFNFAELIVTGYHLNGANPKI